MAVSGYCGSALRFFLAVCAMVAVAAIWADSAEAETGLASWYGPGFAGSTTASGDVYDPSGFTAAHKTLPLGTELVVSYGGRSVNVVVNDRGPYSGDRALDLSQGAAEYLGLDQAGVDYVDYTVAGSGGAVGGYSEAGTQSYASPQGGAEVAGSAAASGGSYVVQSGDTLGGISQQLGTSAGELAAANGIGDPTLLQPGQTLHY